MSDFLASETSTQRIIMKKTPKLIYLILRLLPHPLLFCWKSQPQWSNHILKLQFSTHLQSFCIFKQQPQWFSTTLSPITCLIINSQDASHSFRSEKMPSALWKIKFFSKFSSECSLELGSPTLQCPHERRMSLNFEITMYSNSLLAIKNIRNYQMQNEAFNSRVI